MRSSYLSSISKLSGASPKMARLGKGPNNADRNTPLRDNHTHPLLPQVLNKLREEQSHSTPASPEPKDHRSCAHSVLYLGQNATSSPITACPCWVGYGMPYVIEVKITH